MEEQFKEFNGEIELENITENMFLNDEEKEIKQEIEIIKDELFNKLSENNNLSYIEINHFLLNEISQLLTVEIYKQVTEKDKVLVNIIKPDPEYVTELFNKVNTQIIEDQRFVELFNNHTFKKQRSLSIINDGSLSKLLESNEELQDKIIEIFNKNKDKI